MNQIINGKQEGYWKYFDDNGVIASEGVYINDKKEGIWKIYNDNSSELNVELNYINDIPNGLRRYYLSNGNISSEYYWVNGLVGLTKEYDYDGNIEEKLFYS